MHSSREQAARSAARSSKPGRTVLTLATLAGHSLLLLTGAGERDRQKPTPVQIFLPANQVRVHQGPPDPGPPDPGPSGFGSTHTVMLGATHI